MRIFSVEVKSDSSFHDIYYVEADNLISIEEIRNYVAQVASIDTVYLDNEVEEFEVCDPIEMDKDDALFILTDISVRAKLLISSLNNIHNTVLGIYHKEKNYDFDKPEFFIFSAAAGQEADVTAIGKTDKDNSREQVILNSWYDCISQLKRYWQIPGVVIATGLFTIQTISEEEYELERSEREVVLV